MLAFFEFAGSNAWLYVWVALSAFQLLLMFVAPAWIMPLFITFTPLEEGPLKTAIHDYAAQVGALPCTALVVSAFLAPAVHPTQPTMHHAPLPLTTASCTPWHDCPAWPFV